MYVHLCRIKYIFDLMGSLPLKQLKFPRVITPDSPFNDSRQLDWVPPLSVKKKSIKNWPKNSVFGNGSSVKGGGGVPPFSVKKFPLTFRKNLVREVLGGGGGGVTPPTESFRAWGFRTLP